MAIQEEQKVEFQKASDITIDSPLGFLVYGGSGVGKTEFIGSFVDCGKVFIYDFDRGMKTLRGRENITYQTFNEDPKHPTAYKELMKTFPIIEGMCKNNEIDTVGIDSLTTFGEAALADVMVTMGKLGQNPTFGEWGEQMRRLISFIKRCLALPVNVIFTAHEQYTKDEISGKVWCLPLITGKMAGRISLYFDEVYHLTVETTKDGSQYKMLTRPDRYFTAKSRVGYKDIYVPNTYQSVRNALKNGVRKGVAG